MTHSLVRPLSLAALAAALIASCGGGASSGSSGSGESGSGSSGSGAAGSGSSGSEGGSEAGEFALSESDSAGSAHGDHPSEITATRTMAAMRLFVVDPDRGPVAGTVIKLTGPDGTSYYTGETDSVGYAEVLVPVGQRYDLEYLSLGRRSASAHVDVPEGPNQDIRLTLRHRPWRRPPRPAVTVPDDSAPPPPEPEPEGLVLEGILFESGSATIDPESNPRLDRVVEYMTHMTSVRIQISGHTDNVGNPRTNQALSQSRAEAVRAYLIEHGIEASRVEAIGYGDTRPVASNDTEEGRAENRRIEAIEL